MVQVTLIGSGNVARHLLSALSDAPEVTLRQVFVRNPEKAPKLPAETELISDFERLAAADLYIIAVSDSAITEVSKSFPFSDRLVAHTAGSLPVNVIDSKNRGASFYPLQTFSKNRKLDFSAIPICIETADPADMKILREVAGAISNDVREVNSSQRLALHTAAVFVCNFVNHLYRLGENICTENQLDFNILKPLILETASKVMELDPKSAQTGPAVRRDDVTINRHLEFLKDDELIKIYNTLTDSIKKWN